MLQYHVHHGRPRTRWGAALQRRHMHHHFQDGSRGFGISCPWWDEILQGCVGIVREKNNPRIRKPAPRSLGNAGFHFATIYRLVV